MVMEKSTINLVVVIVFTLTALLLELLSKDGLSENMLMLLCILGASFVIANRPIEKKEAKEKISLEEIDKKVEAVSGQLVSSTQYLMQVGEGVSHLIQFVANSGPQKTQDVKYGSKI